VCWAGVLAIAVGAPISTSFIPVERVDTADTAAFRTRRGEDRGSRATLKPHPHCARVGLSDGGIFESRYMNDIQQLTDESICRLYENIRDQVAADARTGSRHRLLGETARQQAERLCAEMDRRRLRFTPIDW
jgi:hypothetical protein